ncbi:MAG: SoxR reducing system RseC family protein [Christensenellales bacterium]|jgi:positive regulator of sigma E activity
MKKRDEDSLRGEVGIVAKVEDGKVEIHFPRKAICEHCGACGVLSSTSSMKMCLTISDEGSLVEGDEVTLIMDRTYFFVSAWLLYGVPLVALLLCIVVGTLFWGDGIPAAALAIGTSGLCYLVLRLLDGRLRRWRKQHIRVEKINSPTYQTEDCSISNKGEKS